MRLITISGMIDRASTDRLQRLADRLSVPLDTELTAGLFVRITICAMVEAELYLRRLNPFSVN